MCLFLQILCFLSVHLFKKVVMRHLYILCSKRWFFFSNILSFSRIFHFIEFWEITATASQYIEFRWNSGTIDKCKYELSKMSCLNQLFLNLFLLALTKALFIMPNVYRWNFHSNAFILFVHFDVSFEWIHI